MRKYAIYILITCSLLSCTKREDVCVLEISATIHRDATKVSYLENNDGGIISLGQTWEVGDKVIGYCGENTFEYVVAAVYSSGVARLEYSQGYELKGTETSVTMYYAPGCEYSSALTLDVDYTSQDVSCALPCTMTATGNFSDKCLSMDFHCTAAVLSLRGFDGMNPGEKVASIKVKGASCGDIVVTNGASGWTADSKGFVTDTIFIALPPSGSRTVTVSANERQIIEFTRQIQAGNYYYTKLGAVKVLCGDIWTRYDSIEDAFEAVNTSIYDEAEIVLLSDCCSSSILSLESGKSVELDLTGRTLSFASDSCCIDVKADASLTVNSSFDGGCIEQTSIGSGSYLSSSFAIRCSGSLYLNSGLIKTPESSSYASSLYVYGGGNVEISGGTISGARCLTLTGTGTTGNIAGGEFSSIYGGTSDSRSAGFAVGAIDSSSLKITGGDFNASGLTNQVGLALYLFNGASAQVSDGTFVSQHNCALFTSRTGNGYKFSYFKIDGGTFISHSTDSSNDAAIYPYSSDDNCQINSSNVIVKASGSVPAVKVRGSSYSKISITGGYYSTGNGVDVCKKIGTSGTLSISGGYFTSDVSTLVTSPAQLTTGSWNNGTSDGIIYGFKVE